MLDADAHRPGARPAQRRIRPGAARRGQGRDRWTHWESVGGSPQGTGGRLGGWPDQGGFPPPPSLSSVFGHISFRSDWELVKVDFRPWFSRRCSEDDYSSWDLTNLQVGLAPRRAPPLPANPVLPGCQPPPDVGPPAGLAGPSGQPEPGSAGTPGAQGHRPDPVRRQLCSGSRICGMEGR